MATIADAFAVPPRTVEIRRCVSGGCREPSRLAEGHAADTIPMRVGSDSPPGDQHTTALDKFKEIVEAKASGRISVSFSPAPNSVTTSP